MKKQTYLNLNYDTDIKDKFPKSVEEVIKWFCNREDIIEGLIGISGEGATSDEIKQAFKQVVPIIIQHDPRKLYEFFDDQDIKISIAYHPEFGDCFVYYNSDNKLSKSSESRVEAERSAFMDAFEVLEKKLNT